MRRALFDLLWPALCPICDHESAELVHRSCLDGIRAADPAAPFPDAIDARFEDGPGWFRLLHAWKYGGRRTLAEVVAAEMLAVPPPRLAGSVLVPMPDDPARRMERGYGPVADLVGALGRSGALRTDARLLRRRRSARSQTTCADDGARHDNVEGLLGVGDLARWPATCTLVLVDDQVTSGASVLQAAALLRCRGNPVRVWCAARAQRAPRRCLDGGCRGH